MTISSSTVEGFVAPGFEPVRDAFAANFLREEPLRELGASLSVYRAGQPVAQLWGGYRDSARSAPTLAAAPRDFSRMVVRPPALLPGEGLLSRDSSFRSA